MLKWFCDSVSIDTDFYRIPLSLEDIPEKYKKFIDNLLKEPYVIMPGDELRFNDDTIRLAEKNGILLARVLQYGYKSEIENLKKCFRT